MVNYRIPYFKAWLIYSLSAVVLAFCSGMAIGAVVGFIMGLVGVPLETIRTVCGIAGLVLGIIVSFIMFRWTVDRFIVPAVAGPQNAETNLR